MEMFFINEKNYRKYNIMLSVMRLLVECDETISSTKKKPSQLFVYVLSNIQQSNILFPSSTLLFTCGHHSSGDRRRRLITSESRQAEAFSLGSRWEAAVSRPLASSLGCSECPPRP
jgi:hypothetical protein